MTPNRMMWEALRLLVREKGIDLSSGKAKKLYNRKDISLDINYRNETGLCPVCRERPAKRVACESAECQSIWLIGRIPPYYQEWTWRGIEE